MKKYIVYLIEENAIDSRPFDSLEKAQALAETLRNAFDFVEIKVEEIETK